MMSLTRDELETQLDLIDLDDEQDTNLIDLEDQQEESHLVENQFGLELVEDGEGGMGRDESCGEQ